MYINIKNIKKYKFQQLESMLFSDFDLLVSKDIVIGASNVP